MITPLEAWEILAGELRPMQPVAAPLVNSLGAVLAEPVVADRDIPPADRAAMDGYAVRHDDLTRQGLRLMVDGEVAAGDPAPDTLAFGHSYRIFTGANLPVGADTVIPVEHTTTGSFTGGPPETSVGIVKSPKMKANVFLRGENARAGTVLMEAGCRLGPRQVGLAAAVGYDVVKVYPIPSVCILNTGAELLSAGESAADYQNRNSNGPLLVAALKEAGLSNVECKMVPDALNETMEAITLALDQADSVIITGGISAGAYDFVPKAIEATGARLCYRGVAMKPGKPQLFAITSDGKPIFGLPGNPLSSIVGMYELVLPALRKISGMPVHLCRQCYYLPVSQSVENKSDRQLVLPALLKHDPSGSSVTPCPPIGSADLVTGAKADGAVLLPPKSGVLPAGTMVAFRPWGYQ